MHKIRIDASKLGEALQKARDAWGLSPTEWAAMAGMSAHNYYLHEKGRIQRVSTESLLNIALVAAMLENPYLDNEQLIEQTLNNTCNLLRSCISLEARGVVAKR